MVHQSPPGFWCLDDQFVDAGCALAVIHLRHPSHTQQGVRVAPQHEPLQRLDLIPVAVRGCPEDPLSQVAHAPIGRAPLDALSVGSTLGSVCKACVSHLTSPSVCNLCRVHRAVHPAYVSRLAAWVLPYPPGYGFPSPFGVVAFAS